MSFYDLYRSQDLSIVTAARLSASFPYVSPAARARDPYTDVPLPLRDSFHFVDGCYYDNFGISSIADSLVEAMHRDCLKVKRILLIQIRGPISSEDPRPQGRRRDSSTKRVSRRQPLSTLGRPGRFLTIMPNSSCYAKWQHRAE